MKSKKTCSIYEQKQLTDDIFSMWLESADMANEAVPGQFLSLYCNEGSRLLPRPISICEIDKENGRLRMVYRVVGKGTEEFSKLKAGDSIDVIGPLGNGFPLEEARGKKVMLMGGGIGVPPMISSASALENLAEEVIVVAGYRDVQFLTDELSSHASFYMATEDGSAGSKGNVLDAVRENNLKADVIFACGPKPMLKAIKTYAQEKGIACWLSLEERMACGIGACLGCVCQSKEVDGHSHVKNKRVCKDGPVFPAGEVEL